jgi:hypothetical protein
MLSIIARKLSPIILTACITNLTTLDFFFLEVCKRHFREKVKTWMRCWTESSELQSALPMKRLPTPGQKLNIVLIGVVPLIVPILRSAEHVRNSVRFSVWKCTNF